MVETSGRDVEPEPQGTKKENKEWLPISQHISPPSPRRGLTPVLSICGSTITEARHIESREHSPSHASLLPPSHTTDEQGGHHLSDETIPCHRTFAPAVPASWSSTQSMPSAPILAQQRLLREAFLDYLPHPSLHPLFLFYFSN